MLWKDADPDIPILKQAKAAVVCKAARQCRPPPTLAYGRLGKASNAM
jgi:hypothetical protein